MSEASGSLGRVGFSRLGAEAGVAVAVLLGSLYLLYLTFGFTHATRAGYAGSALFPQIALGSLIVCAAKLLVDALRELRRPASDDSTAEIYLDVVGLIPIVVIAVAYALLLERIGFEICTFALMVILLGRRMKLAYALSISAMAMLAIYAIFALLLEVDLPLRFLPAYLPF